MKLKVINTSISNFFVVILSIILSILYSQANNKKNKYSVSRSSEDNTLLGIKLVGKSIFTINSAHIINIYFKHVLERRRVNGRESSNRRSNEYNYG